MIRGTAYLIVSDKKILHSDEFNGGMYPEGHGRRFLKELNRVNSEKEFGEFLSIFSESYLGRKEEQPVYTETNSDIDGISQSVDWIEMNVNMSDTNYFKVFFSDWTFWRNISGKAVKIKTRDKKNITLKTGKSVAIKFGYHKDRYFPERSAP